MVGGDRHLVLPPLRLVAPTVRDGVRELLECTDAEEGGRLGVAFVMMGAGLVGGTGDVDFGGGEAILDFIWLLCESCSIFMGGVGSISAVFFSSSLGSTCVTIIVVDEIDYFEVKEVKCMYII
jgi:hypothetical protein